MKKVNLAAKKKAAILTNNLVCNLNSKYFAKLEKYFETNGWLVADNFNVSKVVISTCGVTNNMFDAVKEAVRDLRTIGFPEKDIIIMGCQTKTHYDEWVKEFHGQIIGIGNEEELDSIIGAEVAFQESEDVFVINPVGEKNKGDKNNLFTIQISSGCLQQCTFCVIKKARGYLKSFPLEQIEAQFRLAVRNGYRNISIMGSDTFAYGYDTKNTNIVELLNHLLSIQGDVKFSFGNLHVRWLKDYCDGIIELAKKGAITFLNIGLQHVNDEVLHSMGRPSFKQNYDIIKHIKEECPSLVLACEIIVGFHGETQEQFQELVDFFQEDHCFSIVSHFMYSDVKAADAYSYSGKLSEEEKTDRWRRLNEVIGTRYPHKVYANDVIDDLKNTKKAYKKQIEAGYYFCKDCYEEVLNN